MEITFIRGNVLQFATQFFDANGDLAIPATVTLTIVTATLGVASQTISLPMANNSGTWIATWDTGGIASGLIYWDVKALTPNAADEGVFDLTANLANATAG